MTKEPEHVDDYTGDCDLLFPSKYIRAADLGDKEAVVTIERLEKGAELMRQGGVTERKPVLHFKETEKMLVLNKTNKNRIADKHGKKVAEWKGKKIVLRAEPWRGKEMAVRVKE